MNLGPHAAFIVARLCARRRSSSPALIVWVVLDHRRMTRALAEFEARGVTRRSERAGERAMSAARRKSTPKRRAATARRRRLLVLCPARRSFSALAALFLLRLGAGDPSRIPSALIGRPAPQTELPPLAGLERDGKPVPGLDRRDLQGRGDAC